MDETTGPVSGKGKATPSRREREAANKRPLVASRQKMTKEQRREQSLQRIRVREAMDAGDEKYLPLRDKGPQRRYVRDIVDSRFTVGEFMIPLLFTIIIATFLPQYSEMDANGVLTPSAALFRETVTVALFAFFVVAIVDGIIIGRRVTKKLSEKFGEGKVERGVRWYAATRALQFRPLRVPKPQVTRGQLPK